MEENARILSEKVEELYKQSKFEEIIALLTDEVLEKQNDAELFTWRARANYWLGDDATISMLFAEKALEVDPNYAEAYNIKGIIWYIRDEYDKAIQNYTKAIKINSNYEMAFYNRGLALFAKKNMLKL